MHLNNSDARGWGIEAMVGGNFCLPNFAAGPDIRIGQTTQTWVMFGLHLEARL
jgi:hypothetical protein